jgi:hypothetical protein
LASEPSENLDVLTLIRAMKVLVTMRLMTAEAGDSKRWQRIARRPTTSESTGSCRLMAYYFIVTLVASNGGMTSHRRG